MMDRRKLALAVREVEGIKGTYEGEGVCLVKQREEQSCLRRGWDEKEYVNERSDREKQKWRGNP